MFCGKCGTPIDDGAVCCGNCGTPVSTPADGGIVAPKGKFAINFRDPKVIGVIAVAALVLVFFLFSGRSYKATVNDFMEGVFDANGSQLIKCIPDELIDQAMDDSGMNKKEMASYLAEQLGGTLNYLDYYFDHWTVSHKITGTEKYDAGELADIKDDYRDDYDLKVKDAMIVIVEMTVKAQGIEETTEIEIGVIKIGGSWYIDVENSGSIF